MLDKLNKKVDLMEITKEEMRKTYS